MFRLVGIGPSEIKAGRLGKLIGLLLRPLQKFILHNMLPSTTQPVPVKELFVSGDAF